MSRTWARTSNNTWMSRMRTSSDTWKNKTVTRSNTWMNRMRTWTRTSNKTWKTWSRTRMMRTSSNTWMNIVTHVGQSVVVVVQQQLVGGLGLRAATYLYMLLNSLSMAGASAIFTEPQLLTLPSFSEMAE
eukprot:12004582-Ditylum_brightwellii.AAC.1